MDLTIALGRVERTLAKLTSSVAVARQKERLEALIAWHGKCTQGPIWCVRITLEFRRLNAAAAEARRKAA